MSNIIEKTRKLEELRKKKEEMDARKAMAAGGGHVAGGDAAGGASLRNIGDDLMGAKAKEAAKKGPVIEVSNFVGVFNMPAKQKTYMYDRCIEVTKEQIQLMSELQEEEKLPEYRFKEDDKDKDDPYNDNKKKAKKIHRMDDEEVEKVFNKPHFKRFIRKGSGLIDSELSDNESLYDDLLERNDVGVEGEKTMLNFSFNFMDESVKGYSVVGMIWCKTNADLLLAVYNTGDITEKFPSKILIWSMKNKLKPQTILTSETKLTRAVFHPRNENLIYAANYSGNLLHYDLTKGSNPQLKNFNVGQGGQFHSVPIFVIEFYFKEQNEFLISISIDGKLCIWNLNFLYEPVVNKLLEYPPKRENTRIKLMSVFPMCSLVTNQFSDEATLVLGTQDNCIVTYKISTLFEQSEENQAVVITTEHHAPICSMSEKQDQSHPFLQDLYLTSSFDFDIQLWKISENYNNMVKRFPIHLDYVVSVDWNPQHPTMFASCDCNGRFLIFDLALNQNYFTYEGKAEPSSTMKWSPDGLKLAFGKLSGEIMIWQLRKKYLKFEETKVQALKYELQ